MFFVALAVDYDGTIATDGIVDQDTLAALRAVKSSGRKLLLVTGRELPDLRSVFPHIDIFDLVVGENGALLFDPKTQEEEVLTTPANQEFVRRLRAAGVAPLSVGRAIVATWEPHETVVLQTVRDLGLELHIVFNKGAVMVLPAGVNKASGLAAALQRLDLSAHNVVAIGDAENDHAFLNACGCAIAVANALPALKQAVDLVTVSDHGKGVAEACSLLIDSDLASPDVELRRHRPIVARTIDGEEVWLDRSASPILIAGSSGGGKSTTAQGILERLQDEGLQCCIVDPEGDFSGLDDIVTVGSPKDPPRIETIVQLLARPEVSIAVNLLAVDLPDRPAFFARLLAEISSLRVASGRPHWLVLDEAHHLMPASWGPAELVLPREMPATIMLTVDASELTSELLDSVDTLVAVGSEPGRTVAAFCTATGRPVPSGLATSLPDEASYLLREDGLRVVRFDPPTGERRRHARKYAEGELGADKSFYFRGPDSKLKLRAQNLILFQQIADGIDDETWLHHLRAGDYSRWFEEAIKDEELAAEARTVERAERLSPRESRRRIIEMISKRYTAPSRAAG